MKSSVKLGISVTDSAQNFYQEQFHNTFKNSASSHIKENKFDRHRQGDYCTVARLSIDLQQSMLNRRVAIADKIKSKNLQLYARLMKVDSRATLHSNNHQPNFVKSSSRRSFSQMESPIKTQIVSNNLKSLNWRNRSSAAVKINHENQVFLDRLL